jgi:hypothetical protein
LPTSNFDIATDLFIYAPIPAEGTFIIGYSLLGGSDVLGELPTFTIQSSIPGLPGRPAITLSGSRIECEVSNLETTRGFVVEQSLYFQTDPGVANITLRADFLDPIINMALRLGKPIIVAHNEDGSSDPKQMFLGWIGNIEVSHEANSQALVNLTLYDAMYFLSNRPGQSFIKPIPPAAPGTRGLDANMNYLLNGIPMPFARTWEIETRRQGSTGFWTTVVPYAAPLVGTTPTSMIEYINNYMLAELGATWADNRVSRTAAHNYNHVEIKTVSNNTINTRLSAAANYTITNDETIAGHYCLGPVSFSTEIDKLIQIARAGGVVGGLEVGDRLNIELGIGDYVEIETVNEGANTAATEALKTEWAERLVLTTSQLVPTSLTLNGIDDLGTLTDIVDAEPAETARVKFVQESGTIDKTYLINKITNRVTADGWLVDLELWRN